MASASGASTLSIVVLNYNTARLLGDCLGSVQRCAPDSPVVVVDNASTDGSAALVPRDFASVRLIVTPTNLGFPRGANLGLSTALSSGAEFVLFLNADTVMLPSTIPPLLQVAQDHPRAAALGPAHIRPDHRVVASAFPDPTPARELARNLLFTDVLASRLHLGPWRGRSGPPVAVDWLMGAALLFRRQSLEEVGLFNESRFMYWEDWDWCFRARKAGWQILLVPESRILHYENVSGSVKFGAARYAVVTEALLHYAALHWGGRAASAIRQANLLGSLLRCVVLASAFPLWSVRRSLRVQFAEHAQAFRAIARYRS